MSGAAKEKKRLTDRQARVLAAVERLGRPSMTELWQEIPGDRRGRLRPGSHGRRERARRDGLPAADRVEMLLAGGTSVAIEQIRGAVWRLEREQVPVRLGLLRGE